MFFVQYVLQGDTSLSTERYANPHIARVAFRSLVSIAWAELVGPDGEVLAYREGAKAQEPTKSQV